MFFIFWTLFRLGLKIFKPFWTTFGRGLRFENSGLDPDRKIFSDVRCFKLASSLLIARL